MSTGAVFAGIVASAGGGAASTAVAGDTLSPSAPTFPGSPIFVNYAWLRNGVTDTKLNLPYYRTDPGDMGVVIQRSATPYYVDGTVGAPITNSGVLLTTPAPFSLSQFGAANYIDHDANLGITVTGRGVAQWDAANGSGSFLQATDVFRPVYQATGWDGVNAAILFDSTSTQSRNLISNEANLNGWSDFWVGRRDLTDQPAVANNKTLYQAGQITTNYSIVMYTLRALSDPSQNGLTTVGLGGGGSVGSTQFTKGTPTIYSGALQDVYKSNLNGAAAFSTTLTNGTTAGSGTTQFGTSSATAGGRFSIARRIRLNNEALKSNRDGAQAVAQIVMGYLAYRYPSAAADLATPGIITPLSEFDAGQPYKNRAPNVADFRDLRANYQTWGNSLTNGFSPQISVGLRGSTITNGGVGGETASQIYTRYLAATDEQKRRVTIIGDLTENGTGTVPVNGKNTWQEMLADMVSTTETLQGVTVGNAQILITGRWRNFISPKPLGNPPDPVDDANDYMAATYPNYFWNASKFMWNLGAPDGPFPDPTNYANSITPAALQNDNIHPNATGYVQWGGVGITNVLKVKGWNRL